MKITAQYAMWSKGNIQNPQYATIDPDTLEGHHGMELLAKFLTSTDEPFIAHAKNIFGKLKVTITVESVQD